MNTAVHESEGCATPADLFARGNDDLAPNLDRQLPPQVLQIRLRRQQLSSATVEPVQLHVSRKFGVSRPLKLRPTTWLVSSQFLRTEEVLHVCISTSGGVRAGGNGHGDTARSRNSIFRFSTVDE